MEDLVSSQASTLFIARDPHIVGTLILVVFRTLTGVHAWIEDVVAKVLAEADKQGLSKRIAEPVWREMIDRCIDHEHEMWALEHRSAAKKA